MDWGLGVEVEVVEGQGRRNKYSNEDRVCFLSGARYFGSWRVAGVKKKKNPIRRRQHQRRKRGRSFRYSNALGCFSEAPSLADEIGADAREAVYSRDVGETGRPRGKGNNQVKNAA